MYCSLSCSPEAWPGQRAVCVCRSRPSPKSIAELEHTFGVRLLERGPQGVAPTLYGAVLVRRGLAVFDELRQGVSEIEFLGNPTLGEVNLGCNESLSAALREAGGHLYPEEPDFESGGGSRDQLRSLRGGKDLNRRTKEVA